MDRQENIYPQKSLFFLISFFSHLIVLLLFIFLPIHLSFDKKNLSIKKEPSYYYYVPAYQAQLSSQPKKPVTEKIDKAFDLSQLLLAQVPARSQATNVLYMVGEKLLTDPLRKLLGEAISAHLFYPNLAQELNLRGTVSVGFTLQVSGELTGVKIVRTSRQAILDHAALEAVLASSPITNVNFYLKQAKFLVINIIF